MIVGLGMDLVEIARVARMLERHGAHMLARMFTLAEQRYGQGRTEPARHLAGRIAAKEAAFKALAGNEQARTIGWRDMEVVVRSDGAPELLFHRAAAVRARELNVARALVTITHSEGMAAAVVVLERDLP
jgi:holo-[acyl-carrier protein] synthase